MHIPDGYLSPVISATMYVITLSIVGFSIKRYFFEEKRDVGNREELTKKISSISVMAATIFVAQMLNWPIPGGTSAHLVGGALAAMIIGPTGACIAMFLVLLVQCLIFGDGGITALGANAFNMAVVDVFAGIGIYNSITKLFGSSNRAKVMGAFLGGWIGITLGAMACGVEIGLSPQFGFPLSLTVPIMTVWHLVLGSIEGIITMLVIRYMITRSPEVLYIGR